MCAPGEDEGLEEEREGEGGDGGGDGGGAMHEFESKICRGLVSGICVELQADAREEGAGEAEENAEEDNCTEGLVVQEEGGGG